MCLTCILSLYIPICRHGTLPSESSNETFRVDRCLPPLIKPVLGNAKPPDQYSADEKADFIKERETDIEAHFGHTGYIISPASRDSSVFYRHHSPDSKNPDKRQWWGQWCRLDPGTSYHADAVQLEKAGQTLEAFAAYACLDGSRLDGSTRKDVLLSYPALSNLKGFLPSRIVTLAMEYDRQPAPPQALYDHSVFTLPILCNATVTAQRTGGGYIDLEQIAHTGICHASKKQLYEGRINQANKLYFERVKRKETAARASQTIKQLPEDVRYVQFIEARGINKDIKTFAIAHGLTFPLLEVHHSTVPAIITVRVLDWGVVMWQAQCFSTVCPHLLLKRASRRREAMEHVAYCGASLFPIVVIRVHCGNSGS